MTDNVTLNARYMAAGVLEQLLLILEAAPEADFGWKAEHFREYEVALWDRTTARQYTLQSSSQTDMTSVRRVFAATSQHLPLFHGLGLPVYV